MSIVKNILSDAVMVAAFIAILLLAQEAIVEVKSHEVPTYADSSGCTAEDFDFKWCA